MEEWILRNTNGEEVMNYTYISLQFTLNYFTSYVNDRLLIILESIYFTENSNSLETHFELWFNHICGKPNHLDNETII